MEIVLVAIIAAIASIASSLIAAFALIQSQKTHKLINSRMDELLEVARKLARAEGIAEGEQLQRVRDGGS